MNTLSTSRSFRSASCIALLAVAAADLASAQAESSMTELQSLMGQRATTVQMTSSLARTIASDNKKVAGNIGSGGGGSRPATALAWQATPGLDARTVDVRPRPPQSTVPASRVTQRRDLASLNPQPLPPVERPRATVAADRGVRPNGIIIVGGKPAP